MTKGRHDEQQSTSSRTALIAMAIGCVLVAVLVGWALTRTVEPATPITTSTPSVEQPMVVERPGDATTATTTATAQPAATTIPGRPQIEGDRSEVRRIAVEDLKAKADRGAVTIIDTRDAASFAAAHIPGALNIPLPSIEAAIPTLPRDKEIVAYCT